jgi:hypothetical protein
MCVAVRDNALAQGDTAVGSLLLQTHPRIWWWYKLAEDSFRTCCLILESSSLVEQNDISRRLPEQRLTSFLVNHDGLA